MVNCGQVSGMLKALFTFLASRSPVFQWKWSAYTNAPFACARSPNAFLTCSNYAFLCYLAFLALYGVSLSVVLLQAYIRANTSVMIKTLFEEGQKAPLNMRKTQICNCLSPSEIIQEHRTTVRIVLKRIRQRPLRCRSLIYSLITNSISTLFISLYRDNEYQHRKTRTNLYSLNTCWELFYITLPTIVRSQDGRQV